MTEQEIQQRLLEAALQEDILFPEGLEERLTAALSPARPHAGKKMARIGAAAAVAAAIAVPATLDILRPAPSFTDTCMSTAEARAELQSALAAIGPQTGGGDLMEFVTPHPPFGHLPLPEGEGKLVN